MQHNEVSDYKLSGRSSIRYVRDFSLRHHIYGVFWAHLALTFDSFTRVKRSFVKLNIHPPSISGTCNGLSVTSAPPRYARQTLRQLYISGSSLHFELNMKRNLRKSRTIRDYRHGLTSTIIYLYRVAQKSVHWLVKCTLKYVRNSFITYWIYKNRSKWEPPCSVHNSQCCGTVLKIDWKA
jgi:hypothetical protein